VLIPQANVCHLMLRADVVEAARAGRFCIWAVSTVDQALELLTGHPAGAPDAQGRMAAGSANALVAARLARLAPKHRAAEAAAAKKPARPAGRS